MCKCRPEIKTPFCGRPGCEWPKQREQAPSKEKFAKVDKILNDMLAIRNVHGDEFVSVHTFGGYLNVENARLLRDWLNKALPVSAHEPPADEQIDYAIRLIEERELSMDDSEGLAAMLTELKQRRAAQPPRARDADLYEWVSALVEALKLAGKSGEHDTDYLAGLYSRLTQPPAVAPYLDALVRYIDGWYSTAMEHRVPASLASAQAKHAHDAILGIRRLLGIKGTESALTKESCL